MPLLDHFHPPLSQRRNWYSFLAAWTEAIARQLNQDLLPERYYAETCVKRGTENKVDMGAPPRPVAAVPLAFKDPDLFEVQVLNDEQGPRLIAAIELVSPANKDRPASRRMFAVKCASYLQSAVSVVIIDVVTERTGNLHAELLRLLDVKADTPGQEANDLYASAYRALPRAESIHLEIWADALAIGTSLPTLPLWIHPEQAIPLHLEQSYQAACVARRIR